MRRVTLTWLILAAVAAIALPAMAGRQWKLVTFKAEWCGVCRKMTPNLRAFRERHPNLEIIKVDVEKKSSPEMREYGRYLENSTGQGLPYMVLLDEEGKVVRTWRGYRSLSDLEADFARLP